MKLIHFFLVLFLIMGLPVFSLEKGDDAPMFLNLNTNGNYILSKKIYGESWILLDFFATYCEPCKKKLPEIEELASEYKEEFLKVYLVSMDKEGVSVLTPYLKERPTKLDVLIDRYHQTAKAFEVEKVPAICLISPQKKIAYFAIGENKDSLSLIREILQKDEKAAQYLREKNQADPIPVETEVK